MIQVAQQIIDKLKDKQEEEASEIFVDLKAKMQMHIDELYNEKEQLYFTINELNQNKEII